MHDGRAARLTLEGKAMKRRLLMLTLGLVAATLVVLTAASSAQDITRATPRALEQADRLGEESEQVAPASVEFICRRQGGAVTLALALGKTIAVPLTCAGDPDPVWALVNAELLDSLRDGALNLQWEVTER